MVAIDDIGKLESFPSKKKVGKWNFSDLAHTRGDRRSKGERRIYHNSELVMVVSIEHAIPMKFAIIKTPALANYDSLNVIFNRLGVDIKAQPHVLRWNAKWKKIRETEELVEIQRIP